MNAIIPGKDQTHFINTFSQAFISEAMKGNPGLILIPEFPRFIFLEHQMEISELKGISLIQLSYPEIHGNRIFFPVTITKQNERFFSEISLASIFKSTGKTVLPEIDSTCFPYTFRVMEFAQIKRDKGLWEILERKWHKGK